jgi:hypothetical protein
MLYRMKIHKTVSERLFAVGCVKAANLPRPKNGDFFRQIIG